MTPQDRRAVRTFAIWEGQRAVVVDVLPGDVARGTGVGVDVGVVAEGGDVGAHVLVFFFVLDKKVRREEME